MLRKVFLLALLALVVAVPAQANRGKELKISGQVVRVTESAVSVENSVGDVILTCLVPERLAEKAGALEVGDRVRMICHRPRGRRAVLVRFERPGVTKPKPEESREGEKKWAAGPIAELGAASIVVQGEGIRLACRVPAEKVAKLAGLKVGDKVKIVCLAGELVGLERYEPAAEKPASEQRLYGRIAELSRASVTVRGEAGSLTCSVPDGWAEKVVGRFVVGDNVKMMCSGSVLTYLEKVA